MINNFETGKYYKLKAGCLQRYRMGENVPNEIPLLCITGALNCAHFAGDTGMMNYDTNAFEEIKTPNKSQTDITKDTKFMVYGTGCNNKSNLFETKELAEAFAKDAINSPSWTGRIIGYKLTPIFEAEKKTILKIFRVKKIKNLGRD